MEESPRCLMSVACYLFFALQPPSSMAQPRARKKETLSEEIAGFSRRRMAEVCGAVLALLAVYVLVSICTYSSEDPSWNISADRQVHNWGGALGAFIADLSLQFLGLSSLLMVLLLGVWAWRLIRRRPVTHYAYRVACFWLALPMVAALLAMVHAPESWPFGDGLGGAIGSLVEYRLAKIFTPGAALLVIMVVALPALWFSLGVTAAEWLAFVRHVASILRRLAGAIANRRRASLFDDGDAPQSLWSRIKACFRRDDADEYDFGLEDLNASRVDWEDEEEAEDDEPQQRSLALKAPPKKVRRGKYQFPPLQLLAPAPAGKKKHALSESALEQNARLLESVLQDFGVNGEITKIRPGPVVTLYELEPAAGTKSSRVVGLADDIARSMSAISTRIAVIPGRNAIGIELPNTTRETVFLRELLEDDSFSETEMKLPLALGKDIGGTPMVVDLAKMPHLLVAGTTGSGKSVAINTMILSLIYHLTPEQCKFIMVDPKMLELSIYDNIPHLLSPVVTDPSKAVVALKWAVKEMENRYRLMAQLGVRNIDGYNKRIVEAAEEGEELSRTVQTGFDPDTGKPIMEEVPIDMNPLPYIVVIVDEMADLMLVAGKEIESSIQRLAQMARAAGIHIIMATQRPSVDVITGVIKANFPTRMSFQVTSKIDSRTILGEQGAEQLLGQGDMLYMAGGGRITRIHGPFVHDKEVENIVAHARAQGEPSYIEDITRDEEEEAEFGADGEDGDEENELYQQAVGLVLRDKKASTSYIQRCLKIGYNRAARLVDRMEREGIVGPANHVGKREVLRK